MGARTGAQGGARGALPRQGALLQLQRAPLVAAALLLCAAWPARAVWDCGDMCELAYYLGFNQLHSVYKGGVARSM